MRYALNKLFALMIWMLAAFASSAVFAANPLEKLMMPGELSSAHAKFEDDCTNCHKLLVKKAQSNLCISCHKDIKSDLDKKSGFHGRNKIVAKSECYACHVEHQGRSASIVQLEPAIFSHSETNYPLEGGHRVATCASCHVAGKKFREAKHDCLSCHNKDQPHKGNLGKQCETCHVVDSWKKVAAFDHDKTKFPLRGGHIKSTCVGCHVGEIYKGVSTACNDCHAIQDVHRARFGPLCQDCHSVATWKDAKFDHNKQTKFALAGAHAKAQCTDCHGIDVRKKISTDCISCHKSQDVHKAQLGPTCGDCHGVVEWRQDVKFDHGLTKFPLTGLHIAVACESCHTSSAFKGVATACISCHTSDDRHEGRFATNCASCHSTFGWKKVAFNHGRDANYPLTGAHANLGCYDCHKAKNVVSAKLPTTCYACHKKQDVHRGAFGSDCARCHTTATFKTAFIKQ